VVELIASQVLDNELVVRLIRIEGLNHIIAITPGVFYRDVVLEPGAVGVASYVQPVARPPLAVMRRSQ
jgi:hypothetical protein